MLNSWYISDKMTFHRMRASVMHACLEPSRGNIDKSKMSRIYVCHRGEFWEFARKVDLLELERVCINANVTGPDLHDWMWSILARHQCGMNPDKAHKPTEKSGYLFTKSMWLIYNIAVLQKPHSASSKSQTYQERREKGLISLLIFIRLRHNQKCSLIRLKYFIIFSIHYWKNG